MPDSPSFRQRATALAEALHEESVIREHLYCAAYYVSIRPCTPEDHLSYANAVLTRLEQGGQFDAT